MSAKIPNDQFLLYGFAGEPSDLDQALQRIRQRARNCPELRLRVEERSVLTYPAWVTGDVEPDQFVVHDLADNSWAGCLAAVAGLAERPTGRSPDDLAAARVHTRRRVPGARCGHGSGTAGHPCAGRRHPVVGAGGMAVRPRRGGAAGAGAAAVSRRGAAVAQRPGRARPSTAGPRHRGGIGSPAGGFAAGTAHQRAPRRVSAASAP